MTNTSFYTGTGTNSTDVSSVVSNKNAAAASEAAAANSEANAASSATSASTSATAASTSATEASTSATEANTSKVAAETAQAASEAALDSFTDQYLGAKSSDPSTDNDGNALSTGALYWNTANQELKVWSGSAWVDAAFTTSDVLLKANNLSGLASAATARSNLGLSTIAASGAYSDLSGVPTDATTSAAGLMSAADKTKLEGVEVGATADQTNAEIKTAYEANSNTNPFTDAEQIKLNDIEVGADVTDLNNVRASGALMEADLTNLSGVKAIDQDLSTTSSPQFQDTTVNNLNVSGNVDGRKVANDGARLDTMEDAATADQTDAEIRAAVEAATDSNVFTDADHTKLDGIEDGATADQTDAEIRAAVESATDSNVFTDADHTKLDAIEAGATADQTDAEIRAAVEAANDSNVFTDADHTKLNGIEALADVTDTTNVVAALTAGTNVAIASDGTVSSTDTTYTSSDFTHDDLTGFIANEHIDWTTDQGSTNIHEDNYTNTTYAVGDGGLTQNNFTDALKSKVDGIETGATADQTAAEIRTLVESATDSNVFTDADHDKLNGVEASADVTDTEKVVAALTAGTNVAIASDGTISSTNTTYTVGDGGLTQNNFTTALKDKLDGVAANANNYAHPNHTGEVTSTGDGATVIADNVVDVANLKTSNSPTNGQVLTADSTVDGGQKWSAASSGDLLAANNLSDIANAATARSNLGAAPTSVATTSANGLMSSTDKSKVDGLTLTSSILHITSTPSFSVRTASEHTTQNSDIDFEIADVNVGNDYNTSTGVFTAPIDGIYCFSLSANARGFDQVQGADLEHNNQKVTGYYLNQPVQLTNSTDNSNALRQVALASILEMDANDTVKIVLKHGRFFSTNNNFSGHLIG